MAIEKQNINATVTWNTASKVSKFMIMLKGLSRFYT